MASQEKLAEFEEQNEKELVNWDNPFNQMLDKLGLKPVQVVTGEGRSQLSVYWADEDRANMISNDMVDKIIKATIEFSTSKYINIEDELVSAADKIEDKYPNAKDVAKELLKVMGK